MQRKRDARRTLGRASARRPPTSALCIAPGRKEKKGEQREQEGKRQGERPKEADGGTHQAKDERSFEAKDAGQSKEIEERRKLQRKRGQQLLRDQKATVTIKPVCYFSLKPVGSREPWADWETGEMRSASRLLSLVAALAALCGLSAQCFVPWQGRAPAVARAAQASKSKPFFKPRPPPIESSPPPKASQISMLDIIYVRKYLAGSQKAPSNLHRIEISVQFCVLSPGAAEGHQYVFSYGSIHEGPYSSLHRENEPAEHADQALNQAEQSLVLVDDSGDTKRKAKWTRGGVSKKGKRWGLLEDKPFKPLPYVELPVGWAEAEVDQFLREQRLEDLNRKIQLGQLEDVEPDIRPPSPPPIYDRQGNRLNTREIRIRKALRLTCQLRILIPYEKYPNASFMGVIIGARGVNHKRLQEATGCRIFIRGKVRMRSVIVRMFCWTCCKDIGDKFQQDEERHMPQHVHIEGETEEQIETATELIMPPAAECSQSARLINELGSDLRLLNPESPEFETHGMQQVALVNGFTLKKTEQRCGVCGAVGHLGFDCPETEAFSYKMADVKWPMGRTTYLVLVRHGERLDEADRFAWQKIRTHETQFDAPLTKAGYKQSSQAGKKILKQLALKGPDSRRLWQTPGVRGLWVDGGDVSPGEILQLLSIPQSSEGDEGDFVLVRKENGVEGWAKVKNLSGAVLPIECSPKYEETILALTQ
eukprot:g23605.t1